MNTELTPDTQVALLLTAPLMAGPREGQEDLLTPGEYQRIERRVAEAGCCPGDLLSSDRESVLKECMGVVDEKRLTRLLSRGFQLSQALERWGSRAIWVVGRNDEKYPARLKELLGEKAPYRGPNRKTRPRSSRVFATQHLQRSNTSKHNRNFSILREDDPSKGPA